MSIDYLQKAQNWVNNLYFDQEDRDELATLIADKNHKELEERFYQELEFGTGGLRNIIGFGSNRINKYTIRKACQAIANIIKLEIPDSEQLVCIGYDSRKFSDLFAQEAAKVFAANSIRVKLFDQLYPVPLLSYSIKHFKACAGVMITASHNPTEYNGLKAYWSDASQLTPPIDNRVIQAYQNIKSWEEIKTTETTELVSSCGNDVFNAYLKMREAFTCNPELVNQHGDKLKIVYTPLHGTGFRAITQAAEYFGFSNIQVVESQARPDQRFPTVKDPNPEYPEALELATNLLQETNSDIVLGSDPDTDRLGVAYLNNAQIVFPSGNQIGALLLDYKLSQLAQRDQIPTDALVIKTIVTTELQTKICKHYGVSVENTLTGFKWMGKKMRQLKQAGKKFTLLFANEESYGYLSHDTISDKDGIDAFLLMCECALYHKTQGRNLSQALDHIYSKYGNFQESLLCIHYPGREGKKIMSNFMELFRSSNTTLFNGVKISRKIDLLESTEFPKSNVLCLELESGHKLWMRPSGTEPKIKFYSMFIPQKGSTSEDAHSFIQSTEDELKSISEKIL